MAVVIKESDLALKFIAYFSDGYDVYKEVPCGGIIDFVAVCGKVRTSVEVKTSFSFKVIEQALANTHHCHYSYVAVPIESRYKHDFQIKLCEMLGVGVLAINKRGDVKEVAKAKLHRTVKNYIKLHDWMKESVAGSQSDRMTAFKNTVREITNQLRHQDGQHIDAVLSKVKHHWATLTSAKSCIYQWCRSGVIKEFRLEKGKLYIINQDKQK